MQNIALNSSKIRKIQRVSFFDATGGWDARGKTRQEPGRSSNLGRREQACRAIVETDGPV